MAFSEPILASGAWSVTWSGMRFALARQGQLRALRSLGRRGFVPHQPEIARGASVLIVGSGPSASAEQIRKLVDAFDLVIALNSARKLTDRAQVHSTEFAHRDPDALRQQLAGIDTLDFGRTVFKPFSLASLPAVDQNLILAKGLERTGQAPRILCHHNMPATLALREPQRLLERDRLPVQWRGSLTLWLDICWLAGVGRIGLVGTDLGTVDSHGQFIDHLTNQTYHGAPALLGVLARIRDAGYLHDIRFEHFHTNRTLGEILET